MPLRMIIALLAFFLVPAGFAGAESCSRATVMSPAPFRGNDGEILKLNDGSVWRVKYDRVYLYEYYPTVIICPSRNTLTVGKRKLNVESVIAIAPKPEAAWEKQPFIESRIDGRFEGWSGETIFRLENGQIWQQASYASMQSSKYKPKVLIVRTAAGYEMQVEGLTPRVRVQILR